MVVRPSIYVVYITYSTYRIDRREGMWMHARLAASLALVLALCRGPALAGNGDGPADPAAAIKSEIPRGAHGADACVVQIADPAKYNSCLRQLVDDAREHQDDSTAFELGLFMAGWMTLDIWRTTAAEHADNGILKNMAMTGHLEAGEDFLLMEERERKLDLTDDQVLAAAVTDPGPLRVRLAYWHQEMGDTWPGASQGPSAGKAAEPRNCFEARDYYSQRLRANNPNLDDAIAEEALSQIMADVGCRTSPPG